MAKAVFQTTVVNTQGGAVVNAPVTFLNADDDTPATLYADRAGTGANATGIQNTNSQGFIRAYLNPGRYKITANFGGQSREWRDVVLLDTASGGAADDITYAGLVPGAADVDAALDTLSQNQTTPLVDVITDPTTDLSFYLKSKNRIYQPDGLEVCRHHFGQDQGDWTTSGTGSGSATLAHGYLALKSGAASFDSSQDVFFSENFEVPYCYVMVDPMQFSPDTGIQAIDLGFADNAANDFIFAFIEIGSGTNNNATIARIISGSYTGVLSTTNGSLSGLGSSIAGVCVTLERGRITLWVRWTGREGWEPLATADASAGLDWADPATIRRMRPFVRGTGGTSTPHYIASVKTGYCGSWGMRDFKMVLCKHGGPYVRDGWHYFTATTNGSHVGVFKVHPRLGRIEKTGLLVNAESGAFNGDVNASLVLDEDINAWRVVVASWHNGLAGPLYLTGLTYRGDILHGAHVLDLDTGGVLAVTGDAGSDGVYDPALAWDPNNSRWTLLYTVVPNNDFTGNPFYQRCDYSADLVSFTNMFSKSGTAGYEGSALAYMGAELFAFAGNGSNFRCWDMAGTDMGTMDVGSDYPSPAGNPPPHFVPFPDMTGNVTEWHALSWQNTQLEIGGSGQGIFTAGTLLLFKADEAQEGFQHPASLR